MVSSRLALAATDYDLTNNCDFKLIQIRKEYADFMPSMPCEGAKFTIKLPLTEKDIRL